MERARRLAGAAWALAVIGAVPAAAGPAACDDPCVVAASTVGYLPPAVAVASGTRVVWTSDEIASHPTTDSEDPAERCFLAPVGFLVEPVPIRFDVDGGTLSATTAPGTPDESTAECRGVVRPDGGSVALAFGCLLHPWMRGALTVDTG